MQQRVVVKIGSSSLTSEKGGLCRDRVRFFAAELARLRHQGFQVLLVTSGAVAAGYTTLGFPIKPKHLHEKQAAASVGQALLMQCYQDAFLQHRISTAQILLTRSDFSNRKRMQNASMTIDELLGRGFIPIINENDTVSVDELKFGDNDTLSALVATMTKANQLIIITDTAGLYTEDPRRNAGARRIEEVQVINEEILELAGGAGSAVGTGGMRSKLEAARIAMRNGIPVFVGCVQESGDLVLAVEHNGKGTYFNTTCHSLPMKKQWVGFHSLPQGSVIVDAGAEQALVQGGKSLLPAGIIKASGDFHPGDVIEVYNQEGSCIGRGVTNYASWEVQAAAGLSTDEVQKRLDVHRIEVIHRDEWVTLDPILFTNP
ncbi:glutamate 5-kinase [Paenibacillus larvae]|uniref:Glutamate 5-kinase n=2 Tax=Paenibacillus larvae subsp. larvae TaxID=147375 RepID=V9W5P0_9BACL|nr:glutamate 5-kinase [Paenibacillus larvae]AHD05249.1 glutamate 5-kinase ProB [Paenibacillus larvae subsp. larvae DSM 25430]AVG11794.1 glutamate 5-kinase ProB [Paenibacillus larvae subsp. larvae DSM 25430]MDR5569711.1 glutamate 5-kinase [Paenibacillus larvae]MDR5595558.1 glutamate 5-kinase [Paenibacillus larvae]QHZ50994.1 glutamate 5-kinase ProB [Paenibacillus larvae subsp. larvae]